jgi:hypothetical protein
LGEEERVNEHRLQRALALWINYRRHFCLTNVNGGLGFWSRGEMDFIAVTGAGYVIEIEIKATLADLRREWRNPNKVEKHRRVSTATKGIRRYFICVPVKIIDKAKAEIEAQPELAYAGILMASEAENGHVFIHAVRPAQNLKTARKLDAHEYLRIAHLAMMRFWDRQEIRS